MEATGNTHRAAGTEARTDDTTYRPVRAWHAVSTFLGWYAEHCRRIRAYMDLTRLDHGTLHAVLSDPEQHDRILDGKTLRRNRHRT